MSGLTLTDQQLAWSSSFLGMDLSGGSAPGAGSAPAEAGQPGGTHAAGGGPGRHKPTVDEQLATMRDQLRGHTKMDIARLGGELLQKQYNDMITGLERARKAREADIDSWKPEHAPLSGKVLLGICQGLVNAAKVAFPEVNFLEIAGKAVELTIKGKEKLDQRAEASKSELEEVKAAAKAELDKLIGGAREQCANQQDKFQKLIQDAADKLDPEELDQLQGMTEPAKVGNFVRDVLGIKRGEDHTPGVIKRMQLEIHNAFNQWVQNDFKRRKSGEGAHEVASKGGHSWESMNLHELYRLKQAGDTRGLQVMLDNLNKDLDKSDPPIPKGWYEKMLHELSDKMTSDLVDAFDGDTNMNVMELPV